MVTLYLQVFLLKEICVSFSIFLITHLFFRSLLKNHRRKLPPGPTGFPVVGALPLMGDMPHITLSKMAKKYGPVMYLKMGSNNMVVASSPLAAKAFLKTLDHNFSNRPPNAGATHLAYDSQDMVFADYGSRWKLLRKISNLHMLGGKALNEWSQFRDEEIGYMVRAMHDCSIKGEPVVVSEMLTYAMANMVGQVILSRRVFETKGFESNEFKDMVVELMTVAGYFNIGDFIPLLGWLDLQGIERGMKNLHNRFDELLTRMIQEHVDSSHKNRVNPDFLDILIAHSSQNSKEGERLTLTNIKALLLLHHSQVSLTSHTASIQFPWLPLERDNCSNRCNVLMSTTPHFIRCIKPNNLQSPGSYEQGLVLQQLRCCGVLEVVQISRSGFPTRMSHQKFARRYNNIERNYGDYIFSISIHPISPTLRHTQNYSSEQGRGEKSRKGFLTLLQRHRAAVIIQKRMKTVFARDGMKITIDAAVVIQSF